MLLHCCWRHGVRDGKNHLLDGNGLSTWLVTRKTSHSYFTVRISSQGKCGLDGEQTKDTLKKSVIKKAIITYETHSYRHLSHWQISRQMQHLHFGCLCLSVPSQSAWSKDICYQDDHYVGCQWHPRPSPPFAKMSGIGRDWTAIE